MHPRSVHLFWEPRLHHQMGERHGQGDARPTYPRLRAPTSSRRPSVLSASPDPVQAAQKALTGLPYEVDEIRWHVTFRMGPNPSYDDLPVFFASYAELPVSCDVETMPYHGGFDAFPSRLHHALAIIVALVSRDHLPMIDNLEFVEMASGDGDLIFNAFCTDSDSNLGPSKSDDE